MPKRILQGTVVSDKTDKTIVVEVERRYTHPLYKKVVRRSKKYHAHDEANSAKVGDRVRIKEGTFENFEGDVEVIDEANGRVTVMINIFGRSTPVELEHWQVEAV